MSLKLRSRHKSFGGWMEFYEHDSSSTKSPMRFSVYRPQESFEGKKLPVLYWLSGLSCTEENFMQKAGAQQWLAKHKIILVAPDTSPRGLNLPGDSEHWSFGVGASYYVNATQEPWSIHYRMYDYLVAELPELATTHFHGNPQKQGIFGHSMGGHGALVLGLRNPQLYKSISALSPICAPTLTPWGQNAFTRYLGPDKETWNDYDATQLLLKTQHRRKILVDQGPDDEFYLEGRLLPEKLLEASQRTDAPLRLRMHPGYDHSYYFVASFIRDHIEFHAQNFSDS